MNNKAIATLGLAVLGALSSSATSAQENGTPYQFHRNAYVDSFAAGALVQFNGEAAVPAGKRLIVENVSLRTSLPSTQSGVCSLQQNGVWLHLPRPTVMHGVQAYNTNVESHASIMTKVYLREGEFRVNCTRVVPSGTGWFNVVIIGTLVDAQ